MKRLLAALLLATSSLSAAEYVDQPYLAQIGITSELHDTLGNGTGVKIGNLDGYPVWTDDIIGQMLVNSLWGAPALPVRSSTDHATRVTCEMICRQNDTGLVGASPGAYVYDFPYWNASDQPITTHSSWPAAFNWAYTNGARTFNVEVSTITTIGGVVYPTFGAGDLDRIKAQRGRLLFTQPAGNNGTLFGNQILTWRAAGTLDNLLIVGAVNADNAIATYSNRPGDRCFYKSGDPYCLEAEKLKYWWVVAPGSDILGLTSTGELAPSSGTSFASPLVASEAAIIYDNAARNGVMLGVADVWAIILSTTTDLGDPGVDGVYGRGMVNVAAALAPVGLTSLPIVPGQIVRDRFRRPYRLDPIPLSLAPTAAAWSFLMGGETMYINDHQWSFTTRQAMVDDIAALNMVGVSKDYGRIQVGFSAGMLREERSALGMVSLEPTVTHLAGVDVRWGAVSAFYMRGTHQGYTADSYGVGLRTGNFSVSAVKPLATYGTPVMALAQWRARF